VELPPYVTVYKGAVLLDVFVQPRAARDAVVGIHGTALKLKVRAAPVEGRANEATEKMIAGLLAIAPSQVSVVSGGTSRHKRLAISGIAAEKVACELAHVLSSPAHERGKEADER
jgi:uncharacterized protein